MIDITDERMAMDKLTHDSARWEIESLDEGSDVYHKLTTDRGKWYVACPAGESEVVLEVLRGIEYPMPPELVELCQGHSLLDIGAHCGGATAYFDAVLDPPKITACEPDHRTHRYLCRNAPTTKTLLWEAAVSSHHRGALFAAGRPCASGIVTATMETEEYVEVATVPAWEVFEAAQHEGEIGLVKIDAEFSELEILHAAEAELDSVRAIYLEYHSETIRRGVDSVLRNFDIAYIRGRRQQGVACYTHRRWAEQLQS